LLSTQVKRNLLLIGLILGEILLISFIVIGLDHFIYPALIATILLYIATPAIDALETYVQIPRFAAIFLIFSLQILFIGYLLFSILPSLIHDAQNLLVSLPSNIKKTLTILNNIATQYDINLISDIDNIEKTTLDNIKEYLQSDTSHIFKTLSFAQNTAGQLLSPLYWLIDLLLIPVLFFFFFLNANKMLNAIIFYTPILYKNPVEKLLSRINTILAGYLRGQVILISILTVGYCIGFSLINLPYAIVTGMVTGILSFVPYLGTTIGIITSLINLSAINSPPFAYFSLFMVFAIVHGSESVFLIPHLIGNSVGLNIFTSFISILIGANYFGMIGVLFAIPTAAVLKYIIGEFLEIYRDYEIL